MTQIVAGKMTGFMERASWIRKMFEEGIRLKNLHGAENVFDFSLGNPDIAPPEAFFEALSKIASERQAGAHAYMPNAGIAAVRQKIAGQVSSDHGVTLSPDDIIMTCGAAGGLNVIFKAILNPEDEVITPCPYFVEYGFYVDNHGGKLVPVATKPDFSLDLDQLTNAITNKTKAVLINSPHNPTGTIYSEEEIKALADALQGASKRIGHPILLVMDEPYRRLVFDGNTAPSVLKHYEWSVVTTSFSKDISVPGERIGYVAAHPAMPEKPIFLGAMTLANRILGFVNAPALMQRVVAQVVGQSVNVSIYQRRRDVFAGVLKEAGYEFNMPQGAFYFFPRSPIADDAKFANILAQELILAVPGRGFGMPGHFRLAFCVPETVIERAKEGFKRAIKRAQEEK